MSLMELHEAERFDLVNPLYEVYERYMKLDVLKYTGIALDRFMELSREQVLKIFELCLKKQKSNYTDSRPLLDELEKMNKF